MHNRRQTTGKYSSRGKGWKVWPIWATVLADVLMVGVILLTFAFFHHVLPAMRSGQDLPEQPPVVTEAPATEAPTVPEETEATLPEETLPEETIPEETEPPVPLTEWQIKFAEHFSDEVIITENSYSSPNVSITLETIKRGEGSEQQVYHVADIYIASMENFSTYTANDRMVYFETQDVMKMNAATNALLSISGDFLTYQKAGFLMRNGEIYSETTNNVSICALFADGTMETYDAKGYTIEDIKARGAVQVWSFGPVLLDENGQVRTRYSMPTAVSQTNPRSAIGYYEPGHYCFVVVDGRQKNYSTGMSIPELAAVFQELGCTKAYNLDGGGSAVMVFNQQRFSRQSNGGDRKLGDILYIRETLPAAEEEG